jgi:hypothetical protein
VRKVVLHLPAWQRIGRQAVTSRAGRQGRREQAHRQRARRLAGSDVKGRQSVSAQAGRQQLYMQASNRDDRDDRGDDCSSVISCRPPSTGYGCLVRLLALLQVTGVALSTSYSCGFASTASNS